MDEQNTETTFQKNTLKNINLLPVELQYNLIKRLISFQENHPKKFFLLVGVLFISLALVNSSFQAISVKFYVSSNLRMESDIHQLQAKQKELTGIINQINQAKQYMGFQISLLNKRLEFLKNQYNYGHEWAITLRELKRIMPKGTWIMLVGTEDNNLKIKGGALNENLVSDFMAALRKSPAFSNVNFNYTQNSLIGKTKVTIFELTCNYDLAFNKQVNK